MLDFLLAFLEGDLSCLSHMRISESKGRMHLSLQLLNHSVLLAAHPEFQGKDFYVTGESYAG